MEVQKYGFAFLKNVYQHGFLCKLLFFEVLIVTNKHLLACTWATP